MRALPLLLGVGRAGFGALAYASPELVWRQAGIPGAASTPDAKYTSRLFGARDLVVGVLTLLPRTQRWALPLGAAFDVLDTASGLLAGVEGMAPQRAGLFAGVAGGFAVAGGAAMISGRR